MPSRFQLITAGLMGLMLSGCASSGEFMGQIRDTAERAAERETLNEVDDRVTGAVRCTFDNLECIEEAEAEGKTVEVVDEQGNIVSTSGETGTAGIGAGRLQAVGKGASEAVASNDTPEGRQQNRRVELVRR